VKEEYTDFIGIYSSCIGKEMCGSIVRAAESIFAAPARTVVTPGALQSPLVEFDRHDYAFNATLQLPQACMAGP
jgi:hypothetical protein